ncbi:major capsid protein [Clostridium sp.]|uniref:major capsid protein n=1 Tax=Clostridium sp. TaxID=1506 RepID=UPI001A452B72|nr:major capsid protein [Clostridium sp.]MBK5234042.1 major capsid protein [Clostridium sp.]
MNIFELVTADSISAYWTTLSQNLAPFLGAELFPSQQKLGLDIKWIKGASGLPVVLKPSAYDVASQKRDRIGFEKLSMEMPFFKEATYIDEELRQQLNMVIETGNQSYIDSIMNRVFNDETQLLEGASAQRERIRMSVLTTGAVSISANGQDYDYDYGLKTDQKSTVTVSWSTVTADIIGDIQAQQDLLEDQTGVRPTRSICSRKTFGYLRANTAIRNSILGNDTSAPVSDLKIHQFILDTLDLDVVIYAKKFKNELNQTKAYVADDIFVIFPTGILGTGWFGTTPEQSDLMAGTTANVSITDVGVAVTTTKKVDPVNVETKVSMIYLPSFEAASKIHIFDIIA